MRPDLDAIRARKKAAEFSSNPADHVRSSRDVPVLLDYIQRLEDAARGALEAIAPCVVGWPDEIPIWVEKLWEAVPPLQRVLGVPETDIEGRVRGGC